MSNEITLINNDTMINLANAVRNLTDISSAFTPIEMINNINNYKEDIIIHGGAHINDLSITELINNKVKYVGYRAFRSCFNLSLISLPNCEYIEGPAFEMCSALQTVSMPKCSNIGYYAFYNCKSLTQVSFPECITIGRNAFLQCSSLSQVSFPKCTSIGSVTFGYCFSLTQVSFPECTSIESVAFGYCYSLTQVSIPKCTYIGSGAFSSCSALTSLYLNQVTTVTTLVNSDAFNYSPLSAGGNGTIYVPSSLVTAFKTATNWSYVSDRIVGI